MWDYNLGKLGISLASGLNFQHLLLAKEEEEEKASPITIEFLVSVQADVLAKIS